VTSDKSLDPKRNGQKELSRGKNQLLKNEFFCVFTNPLILLHGTITGHVTFFGDSANRGIFHIAGAKTYREIPPANWAK